MRTLGLIGTLLFIAGIFLCTRSTHFGYVISGTVVGLLGILILGLTASSPETNGATTRSAKSKNRLRRRSTTGIRSLRMRRSPAGGGR